MSDTPRTDKFAKLPIPGSDTQSLLEALRKWANFSRQLERELEKALDDAHEAAMREADRKE